MPRLRGRHDAAPERDPAHLGGIARLFRAAFPAVGAQTGTAMCLVSVMQGVVAARWIRAESRAAWVAPLFVASSLVAACLTLATWNGWPSACAGLGSLLATTARLQLDPQAMRRCSPRRILVLVRP